MFFLLLFLLVLPTSKATNKVKGSPKTEYPEPEHLKGGIELTPAKFKTFGNTTWLVFFYARVSPYHQAQTKMWNKVSALLASDSEIQVGKFDIMMNKNFSQTYGVHVPEIIVIQKARHIHYTGKWNNASKIVEFARREFQPHEMLTPFKRKEDSEEDEGDKL